MVSSGIWFTYWLLKNYFFYVILNEVKDLSFVWKYEILRCAQNDSLGAAKSFQQPAKSTRTRFPLKACPSMT